MAPTTPPQDDFIARFFPCGVGRLRCPVQRYPWGVPGAESLVAKLAGGAPPDAPCAELWMGAHPSAPAELVSAAGNLPLTDAIEHRPETILGRETVRAWARRLPFLFKVLSINEPLSIQAHPDSALAAKLHARDPAHYPDPGHKPEIGIAIDQVELLAGFRSPAELAGVAAAYPELSGVVGGGSAGSPQAIYTALMHAPSERYERAASALQARLLRAPAAALTPEERYFLRAIDEYGPSDRGLFAFFVLNFVTLKRGEAVFIGANLPHAYLKGSVVECMANSDNVVRAGLTRKFQDTETLLKMLDYSAPPPPILGGDESECEPGRWRFAPAAEFSVDRCVARNDPFEFRSPSGPSIVLVVEGGGVIGTAMGETSVRGGDIYLVPAASGAWSLKLEDGEAFIAGVSTPR